MVTVRNRTSAVPTGHPHGEPRVLPYGGDVAVAQSIADVHRDNPWTGRCRACNEPSPCHERRYANAVLVHSGRKTEPHRIAAALTVVVGVGLGILLIAAGIAGFLW
jgi:hypothetical protein